MKPLIVEFAGLPGAGKTTTAQGVVGLLQAHGYRCALRPALFRARGGRVAHRLRYWWYGIRHWRLVAAAVAYALSIRPLRLSRLWCTKHLLFLAYYQNQQQRSDYDVVLVDQSVVQAMWSTAVYGHTVDAECVQALLDAFYQAAAAGAMAFVVVDIDPATAAGRVVQRPRGWWRARFDRLPLGEVKTVFIVERIALRAITEQAIDATGAPSVAIDGSGPWAANADRIAEFLEALLESGPCATRGGLAVDDALRAFASPPVGGRSDRYAEHDS